MDMLWQGVVYVVDSGFSKQRFYNPVYLFLICFVPLMCALLDILLRYPSALFVVTL